MKQKFSLLLCSCFLAACLSGCGQQETEQETLPPQEPVQVESLALEFAPGAGDPISQMQLLNTMAEALQTALAEAGVTVEEVQVTLGSSQAATGQALDQGGVDAAFLPAETLAAFSGAVPLLTAAWPAPSCNSSDAADWNGQESTWTEEWAAGRQVLLIAGPSEYGRNLASRVEDGQSLTWEELSRASWGTAEGWSDRMTSLWLFDHYDGRTLASLPDTTTYESQAELLAALAAEDVDVIALPADDRIDAAEKWTRSTSTGGWGRSGFIWDETSVIGVTERFYGTTLAVGADSPWAEEPLSTALQTALTALETDETLAGLAGAGPFLAVDGEDLNAMRQLLLLPESE